MNDPKELPQIAEIPVLPLRSLVLFPGAAMPLALGRAAAIQAVEAAGTELLAVVTQRDADQEAPTCGDLYRIGTLAVVRASQPRPGDSALLNAVVQGLERIRLGEELQRDPYLRARIERIDSVPAPLGAIHDALRRSVLDVFAELVAHSPTLPDDLILVSRNIHDDGRLCDFIAAALPDVETARRQGLLETLEVQHRMDQLNEILVHERERQRLEERIRSEVVEKIDEAQRRYFLRQQLEAIKKELGEAEEEHGLADLRQRVAAADLPDEVRKEADRELGRLVHLAPGSPESSVARTYLEWLVELPWRRSAGGLVDLPRATTILDEDHYGLEKVKERILEYLAVLRIKQELKGPILCLVGPPGVGKTSVGRSIARATGRPFVRLSLGGVHDEAEIRGHRRTYVGALPGQIIRGIRRAGARDPVFMLDEVDKLGRDFRGDPAAALLEVLDPEQNATFRDHYLDVPFDLSRVLFLTTANVLEPIPPPLRDRMEVLELPGYIDEEKLQIAERYLVPRQAEANGVVLGEHLRFDPEAILAIVHGHTHEAGVRKLEENIAAICRKRARRLAEDDRELLLVTRAVVDAMLGAPRFRIETQLAERTRRPGVAVALAWTPVGGEVLFVEALRMPRERGELLLTGQLGEVMQESVKTAWSWVRANSARYGITAETLRESDVHVHVPSGAVAKDGPSAGVVMAAALVSLFTGRPVRPFVAMTGEITLAGVLLPIGGLKEKLLAARRSGVRELILPAANEANLREEVPEHLREGIAVRLAATIEEALDAVLAPGASDAAAA